MGKASLRSPVNNKTYGRFPNWMFFSLSGFAAAFCSVVRFRACLDPLAKGQIAKKFAFFSIWTQTPYGKRETAITYGKKKIAKNFIWNCMNFG
jgi:hypothetical protein